MSDVKGKHRSGAEDRNRFTVIGNRPASRSSCYTRPAENRLPKAANAALRAAQTIATVGGGSTEVHAEHRCASAGTIDRHSGHSRVFGASGSAGPFNRFT